MLRVSGIPPGGLIVGVCAVLGVLLPVLRRRQSVAAMWVWDSSQQVLATQGAVYVQGHCLQEQRIVYTSALLATTMKPLNALPKFEKHFAIETIRF